jgi:predicted RNA-binding protein with PIN domain
MSILVDGYNYIGRSQDLRLDDPKARDKIIYLMGQYCARVKKNLTIIFDGNHFVHHVNRKRCYGRVTVIYTSPIYTADDAIKKMVRKQQPSKRTSMLVVSSDAEILDYVKGHGAKVAKSEDFEKTLYRTLDAPKEIDRIHVQLSETEVQEWLELFGPEATEETPRKRSAGDLQQAQDAKPERKKAPMSPKKRLHKARQPQYTPKVTKRHQHIDRENVRLSPSEVDEWMHIFGAEDEDE